MAGNSSIYILQSALVLANLSYWIDYITTNAAIISNFSDTINSLQDQIDNALTTINALSYKVALLEASTCLLSPYISSSNHQITVYYNTPQMFITGQEWQHYAYVDIYTNQNDVYLYCDKTINGLYIDDHKVIAAKECKDTSYFYKFTGSELGSKHTVLFATVTKQADSSIIFSGDNSYPDASSFAVGKSIYINLKMQPCPASIPLIVAPATLKDSVTGQSISTMISRNSNTKLNVLTTSSKVKKTLK